MKKYKKDSNIKYRKITDFKNFFFVNPKSKQVNEQKYLEIPNIYETTQTNNINCSDSKNLTLENKQHAKRKIKE